MDERTGPKPVMREKMMMMMETVMRTWMLLLLLLVTCVLVPPPVTCSTTTTTTLHQHCIVTNASRSLYTSPPQPLSVPLPLSDPSPSTTLTLTPSSSSYPPMYVPISASPFSSSYSSSHTPSSFSSSSSSSSALLRSTGNSEYAIRNYALSFSSSSSSSSFSLTPSSSSSPTSSLISSHSSSSFSSSSSSLSSPYSFPPTSIPNPQDPSNPSTSTSSSRTSPRQQQQQQPPPPSSPTSSSSSCSLPSSSSSSSSSSKCWSQRVSLAPDQKGNLWVLTTELHSSEEVPGQTWVVEAGTGARTWRSVGRASTSSSSSSTSSSSETSGREGQQQEQRRGPLAVCAGRAGYLWALYPRSGRAPQVWLLPYIGPPNWLSLPVSPHTTHPHHTAPVLAHWCGAQHTWLLAGPPQGQDGTQEKGEGEGEGQGQGQKQGEHKLQGQEEKRQTEGQHKEPGQRETQHEQNPRGGGGGGGGGHSLWRLDEQGRWTSVSVMGWTGDADRTLLTWGGSDEEVNKGKERGLYLLQRRGGEEGGGNGGDGVDEEEGEVQTVRVVRVDAGNGMWRSVDILGQHPPGLWLPGPGPHPHLHLVHPAPGSPGLVLTTVDYSTGVTLASRTLPSPCPPSPLHLTLLNGVLVPGIPSCIVPHSVPRGPSSPSPSGGGAVAAPTPVLTLPTLTLTDTCAPFSSSSSSSSSRSSLEHGPPQPSDHSHIPAVVSDGKKLGAPPPSQSDINNHKNGSINEQAYNRVIFFSLSLSIFALVGVVIFVRRCVRCPPTHEIGEGREGGGNQHATPSSPLPVLYSIVSEDVNYDTSANTSPCPSHNALYDATLTTSAVDTPSATTPDGTTPNYMTPDSVTPSNLSPSKGYSRHSLVPSSFSSDAVTRAITGTTTHAIGIATSPTFARHLPSAITNTLPRDHTTTTQF